MRLKTCCENICDLCDPYPQISSPIESPMAALSLLRLGAVYTTRLSIFAHFNPNNHKRRNISIGLTRDWQKVTNLSLFCVGHSSAWKELLKINNAAIGSCPFNSGGKNNPHLNALLGKEMAVRVLMFWREGQLTPGLCPWRCGWSEAARQRSRSEQEEP